MSTTTRSDILKGSLAMAACAVLWSTAGIFIKLVPWHPLAVAGGRSLISFVFLLGLIRRPRFTFSGPQIGAALANAVTMLLFVYANKATTAANAILLQYGAPIYVAIIGAVLLKEKPRAEHWAALGAVVVGMGLLFASGLGGGSTLGNLAAALAGVTFALYIVFMRMQKGGSPLESVILAHLFTAIVAFGLLGILGGKGGASFPKASDFTPLAIAAILGLGLFQVGLASVFFSYGIKRVNALESTLIGVIEPVLNPVWVFLVTGEAPAGRALAGGLVIVIAVLASSVISARRETSGA